MVEQPLRQDAAGQRHVTGGLRHMVAGMRPAGLHRVHQLFEDRLGPQLVARRAATPQPCALAGIGVPVMRVFRIDVRLEILERGFDELAGDGAGLDQGDEDAAAAQLEALSLDDFPRMLAWSEGLCGLTLLPLRWAPVAVRAAETCDGCSFAEARVSLLPHPIHPLCENHPLPLRLPLAQPV